jgi:anthranilate phosphoribosyltransferase
MLQPYLVKLRAKENLTADEAAGAMESIMTGQADEAQLEEYLILLADKGETADEIAGSAIVMRERSNRIRPDVPKLVDTCGTGGDKSGTFNISTTVAFVVAGAGVAVAKHGNKAVSSKTGSSNVLEALGVKIDLQPEQAQKEIEEVGIGFLFAPNFHPAMRYAAPVRAKLGRRTIFNLLGPLTNPAGALHQIIGVFEPRLVPLIAEVLEKMGHEHALVVHGAGIDELTTTGTSQLAELKDDAIQTWELEPEDLGFDKVDLSELAGGDAEANAQITRDILDGQHGPKRDIVVLNAAAALVAADAATDLQSGIKLAEESLDSGKAKAKLEALIKFSQQFG